MKSLGCSLPSCQVCMASCEDVCDTRGRLAFPDVLGIGGIFPFFSRQGQNAFEGLFSILTQSRGSPSSPNSNGLLNLFFGGQPVSYPLSTKAGSKNSSGLFDLLPGGRPGAQYGESSKTESKTKGPTILDLFQSFKNFSGPLLESISETLKNGTTAFNAAGEVSQKINDFNSADDTDNTDTRSIANTSFTSDLILTPIKGNHVDGSSGNLLLGPVSDAE